MQKRMLFSLVMFVLLGSGCTGQAARDAAAAGVFDFISGAVTALLNAVFTTTTGFEL